MSGIISRRTFLGATCAGAVAARPAAYSIDSAVSAGELALLGGKPVRTQPFPSWPVIGANDEKAWMEVLQSGKWNRLGGSAVERFEKVWAKKLDVPHCLATANGTSALMAAVNALQVGPGDEVIVPPYTFVATINVVLLQYALPVFVDTDRKTMQIDAAKIDSAVTTRTRCIIPVHLGGSAANMDVILDVASRRKLPVIEDACQSHLAEWRGKKLATLGTLGCFSFQASKNLNSGEGGAVVTRDAGLFEVCHSFHNQGRGGRDTRFSYVRNGDNRRLTEFQGALLLEQLTRVEEQSKRREENAAYLTKLLGEIPGIEPAAMYPGCTRNAYHIYMMRYDPGPFAGLPRETFLKALRAEGIPCSGGYSPLNKEPFLKATLGSRGFRNIYSAKVLAELEERNHCPENDRLCTEAVWFGQTTLLAGRSDMEQIAAAIDKINKHAPELARSQNTGR